MGLAVLSRRTARQERRHHCHGFFPLCRRCAFRVLYLFFVIEHGRRHIHHFNATYSPSAAWVIQQLREAFPYDTAPKHLIFDRDSLFSAEVKPCRTAFRSLWQNPVAERWIGSCRRELLDHVVVFHERHLIRLVHAYVAYHHDDRTHLGLHKDTPTGRPATLRPSLTV